MATSDLTIDKYGLEDELLLQPSRFMEACGCYTAASEQLSMLELALKSAEAKLALEIRASPENFGIDKVTNDVVRETVQLDDELDHMRKGIIAVARVESDARNLMEAFRHRKSALESLCQLYRMQYYSDPTGGDPELRPTGVKGRMKKHIADHNQEG